MSKQIFVAVDNRESAVEPFLVDACNDTAVFATRSQLTIGDFAVFIDDKLRAIVERKTWTDLAASIVDGRVVTQKQKMFYARAVTGCSLIYLIEGKRPALNASVSHISTKSLVSFLDHSAIRDGIFTIETYSASDSAKRLILFAQSISKLDASECLSNAYIDPNLINSEIRNSDINGSENGGNEVNKNEDKDEINENTLIHQPYHKTDGEIAREMWSLLPGVGTVIAATLSANYALNKAILGIITTQQISDTPLITNTSRAIGAKNAAKIATGLHKLRSHDAILSQKILECVPMVSANVAATILAQYTIFDICTAVIGAAEISALKRATKRGDIAINAKLAERIVTIFRTNYGAKDHSSDQISHQSSDQISHQSSDQIVSPGNGNSNPGTAV